MTALMSNSHPVPWDRVLPRPPALHYDEQRPPLPSPASLGEPVQHEPNQRRSISLFAPTSSTPHGYLASTSSNTAVASETNPLASVSSAVGFEDPFNKGRRSTIAGDTPALLRRERDHYPNSPIPVQSPSLASLPPLSGHVGSLDQNKGGYSHTRGSSGSLANPHQQPLTQQEVLLSRSPSRKRNASLMAAGGGTSASSPSSRDPSPGNMTVATHISNASEHTSIAGAAVGPTHFCLCRNDPKIPRPRNAFILYRQHYQAAVVSQNPGLANPEISKIIGKQWSELPERIKADWKALAEEEKARHQQQYPDYRYQPRRYGRNNSVAGTNGDHSSSSTSAAIVGPSGNCLRCGGKVMNPPSTPDTPFTPTAAQHHHQQNGMAHPGAMMPMRGYSQRNGPPSGGRIGGGPFGAPTSPPGGRPRHPEEYAQFPTPPYSAYREMPLSPEAKRRRFNGSGVYVPSRGPEPGGPPPGPGTPHPYPYAERRTSLPRPEAMMPRPVSMGPPSRGFRAPAPHSPGHDLSLTLPPLQTQQGTGTGRVRTGSPDLANIEATIMSVPPINKIKLLAKVAPPLGAPAPSSPPYEMRGAIIAIEGTDESKVTTMTDYLNGFLGKDGHFIVKRYEGMDLNSLKSGNKDDANLRYLEGIQEMHARSKDMAAWITTKPKSKEEDISMTTPTSANTSLGTGETDASSSVSPKTKPAALKEDMHKDSIPIPIALVPRYQLSMVDTAAVVVPINDSYAPLDHWQWTAALMRGCVGPDITIVVRGDDTAPASGGTNGTGRSNGGSESAVSGPGATNVEIRLADARSVIVTQDGKSGDGFIDEKALRRVGFEVDEYIRK